MSRFKAIVIGSSTGGVKALSTILQCLVKDFSLPIFIVQHVSPDSTGFLVKSLSEKTKILMKEADDKEIIQKGTVYFAPANYHLLIEHNKSIALSVDEKVNYSRPSIDVLFESAANTYGNTLIGLVLTGASSDGALGLKKIQQKRGLTIVQEPRTAEAKTMPESALNMLKPDYVLSLEEIGPFLNQINQGSIQLRKVS